MKCAGAYKRENKIYLNPSSKTTTGIFIETPPRIVVDATESPAMKGKYIREALKHSREDVPHPTEWDGSFFRQFLKETGAKSWNQFAKTAITCTIEQKKDHFAVLPYRNGGPKDQYAFFPIEDRKMFISADASDEELGLLLEKAFEACE